MAEGVRLVDPMAPVDAALDAGGEAAAEALPTLADHVGAGRWRGPRVGHRGGGRRALVSLTRAGETIADLGAALDARLVVVTRPDLGTLNHTGLTLEAAVARGFGRGTLALGSFPQPRRCTCATGATWTLAAGHGWDWVDGFRRAWAQRVRRAETKNSGRRAAGWPPCWPSQDPSAAERLPVQGAEAPPPDW